MDNAKTLAQRMTEGRMPVGEALRCAMQLGEALRRIHDAGMVHGALTPAHITLAAAGVELVPAPVGSVAAITQYTAPEMVQGRPADARSDIFSFAAVVFEMLTGRRAFDSVSLAGPTPSSGSPSADRLLLPCLAKNPDTRTQRMQKVLLELKMLAVAVRRAEAAANPAPVRRDSGVDAAAIRAEMHELEARMAARLAGAAAAAPAHHEPGIDAGIIRSEIHQIESRLAARLALNERTVVALQRSADEAVSGLKDQLSARMASLSEMPIDRAGLEIVSGQINRIETTLEAMRQHAAQFERSVAADLVDIEQGLKVQGASIESARTAMSQTDDLVERVVEALESLQSAVLDTGEPAGPRASFAVN